MKRLTTNAPATVIACIALAVALSGTSYAAFVLPKNSVGTAQIKNGTVTKKKLNKKAIAALHGARGPTGNPGAQGPKGDKGDKGDQGDLGVQGIQGVPGTARAYGLVAFDGTLSRSHNVVSVTRPTVGITCIGLDPSIDVSKTEAVVGPAFGSDSTGFGSHASLAIAEVSSTRLDCPGKLEVRTGQRFATTQGSSDGDIRSIDNLIANQGFSFLVP